MNTYYFDYCNIEPGDWEFGLFPQIIIGRDRITNHNRHYYIGIGWLFWAIFYYYK